MHGQEWHGLRNLRMVLTWKERKAWESGGAGGQEWCAEKHSTAGAVIRHIFQEKGKMLTREIKGAYSLQPGVGQWLWLSPIQWTWIWANSRRWWRTGEPGMLQSMGSQRVGHNLATEKQQQLAFRDVTNHDDSVHKISVFCADLLIWETGDVPALVKKTRWGQRKQAADSDCGGREDQAVSGSFFRIPALGSLLPCARL